MCTYILHFPQFGTKCEMLAAMNEPAMCAHALQENGDHALMVPSPEPGDWFMFAFVNERPYQDYVQKV